MSAWIVPLALLLFGLQIVALVRVVRRILGVQRLLRDPQKLRQLLSSETLAALERAGMDPDSLDIQKIQKSRELRDLLAVDLRRLVGPGLLNPLRRDELPLGGARSSAPTRAGNPERPAPIDAPSGSAVRVATALALLGVAIAACVVLLARP